MIETSGAPSGWKEEEGKLERSERRDVEEEEKRSRDYRLRVFVKYHIWKITSRVGKRERRKF